MLGKSLLELQDVLQGNCSARHHGVLIVLVVVAVLYVDILIIVVVISESKNQHKCHRKTLLSFIFVLHQPG